MIGILEKLCVIEANRAVIIEEGCPRKFADLLTKFDRHTIAQRAITQFVVNAIKFQEFGRAFLDVIMPIAINQLAGPAIEGRAFAWNFLKGVGVDETVVPLAAPDVWTAVQAVSKVAERSYGGEVPRAEELGAGTASGAQMMALLMQLIGTPRGK
jgi:hypothetical protein